MRAKIADYIQRIWYEMVWMGITTTFRFYFRRWQRANYPKLKRNTPTIYVANHQNAFLDALALIMSQDRHPMFLVRANIFKSSLAAFWLRSLNMMPIYRIRDGIRSVARNDEVIEKCVKILKKGRKPLAVFPEGNHNLHRYLRPLQKGLSRIAFTAMKESDFQLDLKIVPVGISYSRHTKARSDLLVNFGEPINVKDYVTLYKENANKAYSALTSEIENRIKPLIIDIHDHAHYEEVERMWLSQKTCKPDMLKELHSDQRLVNKIIEDATYLDTLPEVPSRKKNKLIQLFGFPVYLYGIINGFLMYFFTDRLIKKVVTDIHFYGSVKLAAALGLGTITFLIQTSVVYGLTGNLFYAFLYLFSLPFSIVFATDYRDQFLRSGVLVEPTSDYLKTTD